MIHRSDTAPTVPTAPTAPIIPCRPSRPRGRRRPARRGLAALAAGALLLVGGCASGGSAAGDPGPYATLVVRNDATATVNVYALRGSSRQRLGTLRGLATERFEIRRTMLGAGNRLNLMVDPIGSQQTYRAYPVYINEGDVVEVAVSSLVR